MIADLTIGDFPLGRESLSLCCQAVPSNDIARAMLTVPIPKGLFKALKGYGATPIVAVVLGLGGLIAIGEGKADPIYVVPLVLGLTGIVSGAEGRRDRHKLDEKKLAFDISAQKTYIDITKKLVLNKANSLPQPTAGPPADKPTKGHSS